MADTLNLRIVEGSTPGKHFELPIGRELTVGRDPGAAIRIDTPGISRRHFDILWDGTSCRVRDLKSRNGVFVNGARIGEAAIRQGDRLEAGGVVFELEISPSRRRIIEEVHEETSPAIRPPSSRPRLSPISVYDHVSPTLAHRQPAVQEGTPLAALTRACAAIAPNRMFALVDGAQAFELAFEGRLLGNRLYTLFTGALAVQLAHVGPCLVELSNGEPFLEKWLEAAGHHVGVLFRTSADLVSLYEHLRHLFIATDESGREYFFRFYDPRVLRVFLPTCRVDELLDFFGPISDWIVERDDGRGFMRYAAVEGRLTSTDLGIKIERVPASR